MKERIRSLMKSVEMSQQDFANKLEIAPASLSNIFTGKTNPTNNHVMAIHRAFPEVNINWLLFGEGEMYNVEPEFDLSSSSDLSLSNSGEQTTMNPLPPSYPNLFQGYPLEEQTAKSMSATLRGKRDGAPQKTSGNQYLMSENIIDKPIRKIKEIRVFFDDGTYESFVPSSK
ncbi:MAG: helix-turn-helix transcriptional regulator [Bacteroidaceae bacterium]|nr:helix-turn-helix transcriptional regulator [Bacteroidaceae bacterium]